MPEGTDEPGSAAAARKAAAKALQQKLESLDDDAYAAAIARELNSDKSDRLEIAARFRLLAAQRNLEILEEAIALHQTMKDLGRKLRADELWEAEEALGIHPEYWPIPQHASPEQFYSISLSEALWQAHQVAKEARTAVEAGSRSEELSPLNRAIIRICSAIAIGAFLGAPIGTLIVHENVAHEMIKAGIATGFGAISAEAVNALIENDSRRGVDTPRTDEIELPIDEPFSLTRDDAPRTVGADNSPGNVALTPNGPADDSTIPSIQHRLFQSEEPLPDSLDELLKHPPSIRTSADDPDEPNERLRRPGHRGIRSPGGL